MRLPHLFSRRTSFLANTVLLVGGSGASQIVLAVTAPLLTRLYSPADFGAYAVLQTLANFGAVVASLRYETAIVLPRTDRAAANLAALCFILVVAVSLASGPLAALLWWGAGSLHGARFAPGLALLVPLSIAAFGVQQVQRAWLTRAHLFGAMTTIVVVQSVTMVALQIAAGLAFGSNALSLIAASLAATMLGSLAALPALRGAGLARLLPGVSVRRIRAVAQRYRRFALYTAPYSFVSQVSQRGPVLLLVALSTAGATGAFALAQRIVYLPVALVAAALSQAFYRHAAGRLEAPDIQALIRLVLLGAVLVAGPVFVLAGLNMETLFGFVFGENWQEGGRYAAWLTLAGFMAMLTFWLDRIYDMTGRQRLALILALCFNVVSLSIFGLFLYGAANVSWAVAALAMTATLYGAIYLAITLRIAGLSRRLFMETMLAALAVAAYAVLVHYGVRGLVGYGAAYGVLVTVLAALPVALGIWIVLGKVTLPPLGAGASGLPVEQPGS